MNQEANKNKIIDRNEFIEPFFCSAPNGDIHSRFSDTKPGSQQILINPINPTYPDLNPNYRNPNYSSFPGLKPPNPLNPIPNLDYSDDAYIRNESLKLALSVYGLSHTDYNFMSLKNKHAEIFIEKRCCKGLEML